MKKDKKFLEELGSFLGNSKHKDEIISKYDSIIKSEKANGKRIKYILKDLGSPEEIAEKELSLYKKSAFDNIREKFAILKSKIKEKKDKKEKTNSKDKKSTKVSKNDNNFFKSLKEKYDSFKNKKNDDNKKELKEEKKKLKEEKKLEKKKIKEEKKKDKSSFKEKLGKVKSFLTKDLFSKKRKVTDSPKEIVEEVKEEVEEKISDVSEIVSETHVFESKEARVKRIVLRTFGVILTCLLVFIWLWVCVLFFASLFAYLDGIKFKGVILAIFGLAILVLWIAIMVNRAIFRKKMSVRLNLIIVFVSVAIIALGGVMAFKEIKEITYVQDVSEKYSMTRKLETYDLPKESNEKFIITFNSNYNTQYVIKHDKNIKGKVKIDTRYYECYYDYYAKTNIDGVYISLKLDDRDRFSVYLDDIKEGKIYDNDELSRYTVKITVNPDEANKIAIQ